MTVPTQPPSSSGPIPGLARIYSGFVRVEGADLFCLGRAPAWLRRRRDHWCLKYPATRLLAVGRVRGRWHIDWAAPVAQKFLGSLSPSEPPPPRKPARLYHRRGDEPLEPALMVIRPR